jgi:hypothetical protein
MSNNLKFVQAQAFTVAGAGAILGDTTVDLSTFNGIDGTPLTMTNFGTKGFMTFEPNSGSQEEQISFTGITQNANGTATLTGISNVLFVDPYTEVSGFAKTHAGGVQCVVSNTSGFYNSFANRLDDDTILNTWTFTLPNYPQMDSVAIFPTLPTQLVPKAYADSLAFNGAPNASPTVQGLVQEATTSQLNAGTNTGSTGAVLFGSPADFAASIYGLQLPTAGQKAALASTTTPSASNLYVSETDLQKAGAISGSTTGSANAYVFTPSPAVAAYTAGMSFVLKANFSNTGAATLNVSALGAIAIKKYGSVALVANDILSGQEFQVTYDGTNFQLQSPVGNPPLTTVGAYASGNFSKSAADTSATQTIAHGLGKVPVYVRLTLMAPNGSAIGFAQALTTYNGTTQVSTSYCVNGAFSDELVNSFTLNTSTTTGTQTGVVTFDATNISIVWTKTGSPTGAYAGVWEAIGPTN